MLKQSLGDKARRIDSNGNEYGAVTGNQEELVDLDTLRFQEIHGGKMSGVLLDEIALLQADGHHVSGRNTCTW